MQRRELALGGFVLFKPGFVAPAEASLLFERLLAEVAWQHGEVRFFGKTVAEPRLTAWFGERDYTYSGRTLRAQAWSPLLLDLLRRVETATRARFNAVLLNRYRDGNDSMGLHADDERELGINPVVGSLTFGAARRFLLEPRPTLTKKLGTSAERLSFELGHGDLLVMGGTCQHCYKHGVPKQPGLVGERVNLTFRYIIGEHARVRKTSIE